MPSPKDASDAHWHTLCASGILGVDLFWKLSGLSKEFLRFREDTSSNGLGSVLLCTDSVSERFRLQALLFDCIKRDDTKSLQQLMKLKGVPESFPPHLALKASSVQCLSMLLDEPSGALCPSEGFSKADLQTLMDDCIKRNDAKNLKLLMKIESLFGSCQQGPALKLAVKESASDCRDLLLEDLEEKALSQTDLSAIDKDLLIKLLDTQVLKPHMGVRMALAASRELSPLALASALALPFVVRELVDGGARVCGGWGGSAVKGGARSPVSMAGVRFEWLSYLLSDSSERIEKEADCIAILETLANADTQAQVELESECDLVCDENENSYTLGSLLSIACWKGYEALLRWLLQQGISLGKGARVRGEKYARQYVTGIWAEGTEFTSQFPPLLLCIRHRQWHMIPVLLEGGADVSLAGKCSDFVEYFHLRDTAGYAVSGWVEAKGDEDFELTPLAAALYMWVHLDSPLFDENFSYRPPGPEWKAEEVVRIEGGVKLMIQKMREVLRDPASKQAGDGGSNRRVRGEETEGGGRGHGHSHVPAAAAAAAALAAEPEIDSPNSPPVEHLSPLLLASDLLRPDLVRLLLKDLNIDPNNRRSCADMKGGGRVAVLPLEKALRLSPSTEAEKELRWSVLEALVEVRARPELLREAWNHTGDTSFSYTAVASSLSSLLIETLRLPNLHGPTLEKVIMALPACVINRAGGDGWPPLRIAAQMGYAGGVLALVAGGADVSAESGTTLEKLSALLGPSVSSGTSDSAVKSPKSPLFSAVANKQWETALNLLSAGGVVWSQEKEVQQLPLSHFSSCPAELLWKLHEGGAQ
uniref:Uncharacterized protein n=1 Tax=Chromera velia CCMP2878 TaxID=1169474 RepID=A0A0G4HGB1_9ALVE|eukprot:Cvel_27332.t1-p1 / transcript=Cvel_27332.t1 / gene=Cvel_27332 / organism=Chromera_velia_CCMP2878 / gene_product=hypothetical protein / transcript_product=hypothetical protein / location=Cvel_scaffold3392:1140-4515(+) / protein_length=816 / sequence_SO=supercontig / SO=protein_coding / is_pseudo=false